jgi:UDP-N-acetylmuramoyl-L-alanyl-D-glutamate--2,6-diaminopimelate ligase
MIGDTMTLAPAKIDLRVIIDRVAPLAVLGDARVSVTDVVFDHRKVRPGALFCCLSGEHHDGHDFAHEARMMGAVAFICEHSLTNGVHGAAQLVVAPGQAREAMARAACAFFGEPASALRTVGVTGTNGKTTTTHLIASILTHAGMRTGVIGTLDGERTTPEAPELQRRLATQRSEGYLASALEVSSHALVQHRVDGMIFDVAVFTNLTQDHLDFHHTMEAYFAAKAELFRPEHARVAVVNGDDEYGMRLIDRPSLPTIAYSLSDVTDLVVGVTASQFRLGRHLVRFPLGGLFNVYNALGAASAARALDVGADAIVAGLESARAVPGRFQSFAGAGVTAIVDYAHTPAGLEQVLRAARDALAKSSQSARLLVVFGCGGDRDRAKRPIMGSIAVANADLAIVTSDNPRHERPESIIEEIVAGMVGRKNFRVEADRRRAIGLAIATARPGDVVVVAGKGHESTQQIGDELTHFDDREIVQAALSRLEAHRQGNPA